MWVVVVAGGSGDRYGSPKQYEVIAGRPVLEWSVDAARAVGDGVVVVVPAADVDSVAETLGARGVVVAAAGATRTESVRCGVASVPVEADIVLVHDAARPAATAAVFSRVVDAVRAGLADGRGVGVVPVVPVTDSIRHVDHGAVDRTALRAVQTPQGFPAARFREVLADAADASDDASLFEHAGERVVCVDGEVTNVKLTHPSDHATLSATLTARRGGAR